MKDRILISAIACDPTLGSEPYVGWNWLLQSLNATHDRGVVLLTRRMHAGVAKKYLPAELQGRVEVLPFDLPGLSGMAHHHKLMKLYYVFWQIAALFVVAAFQYRTRSIGVVHHCTYNVVDMPGFLWAIPGTRFIWGPVGGGQIPPGWAKKIYGAGWAKQCWRTLMKRTIRFNPLVVLACWKASTILVANDDTLAVLPRTARGKTVKMLETAIEATPRTTRTASGSSGLFNILWVGRLEPRKALIILLDALSLVRKIDPELFVTLRVKVVGTGPDESRMRARVQACGLEAVVDIAGALPFAEVQPLYRDADLFVFTSVQDTSGNVLLEALSSGIPSIALDHQGAREILREGGGLLLKASSYDSCVSAFAEALMRCAGDRSLLNALSTAGMENAARNFTWAQKTGVWRAILEAVLEGKAVTPEVLDDIGSIKTS